MEHHFGGGEVIGVSDVPFDEGFIAMHGKK